MNTLLLAGIFIAICGFGSGVWYYLYQQTQACNEMKYKACCIDKKLAELLEKVQ